jgi:lysozyme family protein
VAAFKEAYAAMRLLEGPRHLGYVNDPADPGGETLGGIARNFWPNEEMWKVVDGAKAYANFPACLERPSMLGLLEDAMAAFYLKNFWTPLLLDAVPSQALADEIFEEAVNMGTVPAVRSLQTVLNSLNNYSKRWPDIAPDGKMGPATVAILQGGAAKAGMLDTIRKGINCLQGAHYIESKNEKFTVGWMARVSL